MKELASDLTWAVPRVAVLSINKIAVFPPPFHEMRAITNCV